MSGLSYFRTEGATMGSKGVLIERFVSAPKETNTYLIISGSEAAVVDASNSTGGVVAKLEELGVTLIKRSIIE